ncbi:nicotinate phosphoribosyltransferase [Actinocorallia longicatena]|uniref:Nicotinate phosphoribosyltransferase n=2 Tax=Actinocorallia longicatena TaxID=111803 RepID=A0ABP6QJN0_9ACTN
MLQAALRSGTAARRSVFEVFARRLPQGRRYGVVAGTGRFIEAVADFRFDPAELAFLAATGVVDDTTAGYLEGYRFTGDVWGYAEGDCYFPESPILRVEGTFAEAVILETLALSIFNHDCAIAAAASRMVHAAGDRPLIEMGSRRTHEDAAVAAARAAYLCGFATTSNLEAGRTFGVPTAGTAAHAFTLLHDDERTAFAAQLAAFGQDTTLLVDTYDVTAAVALAIELAPDLRAVRIDSGDLRLVAEDVRKQLDALGAPGTRIVVTGDLDEYAIAALAVAPVDGYGVGTSLVTGSGAPTASLVYKLVAREDASGVLAPVAKASPGKPSRGGRKHAYRRFTGEVASAEVVSAAEEHSAGAGDRPLQVPLIRAGEPVGREPLTAARDRHLRSLNELPAAARHLSKGDPALPTVLS